MANEYYHVEVMETLVAGSVHLNCWHMHGKGYISNELDLVGSYSTINWPQMVFTCD